MNTDMNWPELRFPPINLWNCPRKESVSIDNHDKHYKRIAYSVDISPRTIKMMNILSMREQGNNLDINITERVIKIVSDITSVSSDNITEDSKLFKDLQMDSLTSIEMVVACEEEFGIEADAITSGLLVAESVSDVSVAIHEHLEGF